MRRGRGLPHEPYWHRASLRTPISVNVPPAAVLPPLVLINAIINGNTVESAIARALSAILATTL